MQNSKYASLTVVADLAGLTAVLLGLSSFVNWLGERNVVNVLLISGVYLIFCVAVYLIRKLQPQTVDGTGAVRIPDWLVNQKVMAVLAVIFGLTLAVLILDQLGYWESVQLVDDRELGAGESSAFFVYAPGAFIAIAFFYILVLSGKTRETILLEERRYLPMVLFGLLGVNGMLWVMAGVFRSLLVQSGNTSIGMVVLSFVALTVLFLPPRIWYLTKRPFWDSLITFLLLLVVAAWQVGA